MSSLGQSNKCQMQYMSMQYAMLKVGQLIGYKAHMGKGKGGALKEEGGARTAWARQWEIHNKKGRQEGVEHN